MLFEVNREEYEAFYDEREAMESLPTYELARILDNAALYVLAAKTILTRREARNNLVETMNDSRTNRKNGCW